MRGSNKVWQLRLNLKPQTPKPETQTHVDRSKAPGGAEDASFAALSNSTDSRSVRLDRINSMPDRGELRCRVPVSPKDARTLRQKSKKPNPKPYTLRSIKPTTPKNPKLYQLCYSLAA